MTLSMINQSIQFSAWLVALIELVMGLYVLVLNVRHSAHRNTSLFLVAASISTYAIGWMIGAKDSAQALLPAVILAMVYPVIQPLFLVTLLAIVRPEWLHARGRWFWWLIYLFSLVPAAATILDMSRGTQYWFSGITSDYSGGFVPINQFTSGAYAYPLFVSNFIVIPVLVILFLLYFTIIDKRISLNNRRLSWLLLITEVCAMGLSLFIAPFLIQAASALILITLLSFAVGFSALQQLAYEQRAQHGSLQLRLTALIVVVTIPLLVEMTLFIIRSASALLDQQTQQELFIILGVGALTLLFLSWLTIRQALLPIRDLTKTATSVATGDLTRVATVQSDDEIGGLARAFNSMTTQLRESITNLERRVADRTRDLERRAVQLQVAAEVASQAAAIRDLGQLMNATIRLISERFNFYHAGLFLIDENEKYAVLRAASSEGGQRMLARGHQLAVGQVGIVGYVAGKGEPRIALDVGTDAVYFNNPDLPQTHSEMALPLKIRERTIGVLDVQSIKAAAFTNEDIEVLQILADQIALAIENAKLITESQEIIQELGALYQQQVSQSWRRRLEGREIIYAYHQGKVTKESVPPAVEDETETDPRLLRLPIILRGQSLGWIALRRNPEAQPWSTEESELAAITVSQLALALENSRLLEENRRRAQQEELLGNVSTKTQGLLDVESVLKAAVQEIGRSLGLAKVQIQLGNGDAGSITTPQLKETENAD